MSSGAVHQTPEASFRATASTLGQYLPVKNDTGNNYVVVATAATDEVVGFTQVATAAAGEAVTVKTSGYTLALAGSGGWTRGDKLTPSTAGVLITTTTAGDKVCAIAEDTVSATEYGEVRIINPTVKYSAF